VGLLEARERRQQNDPERAAGSYRFSVYKNGTAGTYRLNLGVG
jgi:hypothetical protein